MTLAELLLVATMIGLLGTIALPRLRYQQQVAAVDAAAQRFRADLRRAQTEAIRRNVDISVYRVGLTQYRIEGMPLLTLNDGVTFSAASPDSVRFARYGAAVTGTAAFTLAAGLQQRAVLVNVGGGVGVR